MEQNKKRRRRVRETITETVVFRPSSAQKVPQQPKLVIGPESICVVSIHERGQVKSIRDGIKFHTCIRKVTLSNECVKFFTSEDGKPYRCKENWRNMNKRKRLEANLEVMAEGQKFEYEVIG